LSGISWKEYSFVNIPADQKSGLRSVLLNGPSESDDADGWVRPVSFYTVDMSKESIMELSESAPAKNVLSGMKKKDAHFTYMNMKGTFLSVSAYDCPENNDTNSDEKSTFNQSNTTIDNELGEKTHALSMEESAEETEKMTELSLDEGTEDILSITDQLSTDLATKVEGESDVEDASETEEAEELSEDSDEETDTAPADDEDKEEDKVEDEEVAEESTDEEQLTEEADIDAPEEQATTEDSEAVNEELEALRAQVETLKTENTKLKKSLHYMLAERVVDAKIAVGLEESDNRPDLLAEHATRTASSLADALRDLGKFPTALKTAAPNPSLFEMSTRATVAGNKDKHVVTVEEKEEDKAQELNPELFFTDVFTGRKRQYR
jgi:hypothetical protein